MVAWRLVEEDPGLDNQEFVMGYYLNKKDALDTMREDYDRLLGIWNRREKYYGKFYLVIKASFDRSKGRASIIYSVVDPDILDPNDPKLDIKISAARVEKIEIQE